MARIHVVALAAFALSLCILGCEQTQQEDAYSQSPDPIEPPLASFPMDQIPDAEPEMPAEPAHSPSPYTASTNVPSAYAQATVREEPVTTFDDNVAPVQPAPPVVKTTTAKPRENYAPRKADIRTHVVRKGDTLQKISRKYYGTTRNYPKIFQANRDKLKNPDQLTIGTRLVIP